MTHCQTFLSFRKYSHAQQLPRSRRWGPGEGSGRLLGNLCRFLAALEKGRILLFRGYLAPTAARDSKQVQNRCKKERKNAERIGKNRKESYRNHPGESSLRAPSHSLPRAPFFRSLRSASRMLQILEQLAPFILHHAAARMFARR
jgi:hypothetical protein